MERKESVKTRQARRNTVLAENRTRENKHQTLLQHYSGKIANAKTEITYSTCGGRIWGGFRKKFFIGTTLLRLTPVLFSSDSRNCFRA